MNVDMDQHETTIIAPDDSAKVVYAAVLPSAQLGVVIPVPTDPAIGHLPNRKPKAGRLSNLYGLSLAWRGLGLLGIALGLASVWFVWAWFYHGRMPLGLLPPPWPGIGEPPSPILPPIWLAAIIVPMAVVSFGMMLLGTQDITPKMKFKR